VVEETMDMRAFLGWTGLLGMSLPPISRGGLTPVRSCEEL
jgi:hypothetical protein